METFLHHGATAFLPQLNPDPQVAQLASVSRIMEDLVSSTKSQSSTGPPPAIEDAHSTDYLIERTKEFVRDYMSQYDASHDYHHVLRVLALAQRILKAEVKANASMPYNPLIVTLAALCHDIGDHKYTDIDHTNGSSNPSSTALNQDTQIPTRRPSLPPTHQHANVLHSSGRRQPSQPATSESTPSSTHPPVHAHFAADPRSRSASLSKPQSQAHTHPSIQIPSPSLSPTPTPIPSDLITPTSDPATLIKRTLLSLGFPPLLASQVQTICKSTSYSHEILNPARVRGVLLQHPELAIVQDADRLDALGAVGIGRAFTYGGAKGRGRGGGVEGGMGVGMEETVHHHFEDKLFKLEGLMKTGEGRRLAKERTAKLRVFRRWWEEESAVLDDVV